MNISYSPPHVVSKSYVDSIEICDISIVWTRMAADVFVMEKRISGEDMALVKDVEVTIQVGKGSIKSIKVPGLYKAVYAIGTVPEDMTPLRFEGEGEEKRRIQLFNFGSKPEGSPYSWWLNIGLIVPSERIRYPALPSKINATEGIAIGDLREIYSFDGNGFALRELGWGRD